MRYAYSIYISYIKRIKKMNNIFHHLLYLIRDGIV